MTDDELRKLYKSGLGHDVMPLVPHNHLAGLRAVYEAGRAAQPSPESGIWLWHCHCGSVFQPCDGIGGNMCSDCGRLAEPLEQSPEMVTGKDGHAWAPHERDGWSVCSRCGMVRNYDRETPCSGARPEIRVREASPERGTGGPPWRCARCGCPAANHVTDDEERRECTQCGCEQYVTTPANATSAREEK